MSYNPQNVEKPINFDPFAEDAQQEGQKMDTRIAETVHVPSEVMEDVQTPVPVVRGQVEEYTRASEILKPQKLFTKEEIKGVDIVVLGYQIHRGNFADVNGEPGHFMTIEFIPLVDGFIDLPADKTGIVNCGGWAMKQVQKVFERYPQSSGRGPIVFRFVQGTNNSGQMFWDIE